MRYRALASDYDGTLATTGRVAPAVVEALGRLKAAGWRILVVSGRSLDDLLQAFTGIEVCDLVVAEDGGVIARPDGEWVRPLAPAPAPRLLAALAARGVRFQVGRTIVHTHAEFEERARTAVAESGVRVAFSLNKGALMLLPEGVNKASGLREALKELALPAAAVVGVGDAENDRPFLSLCGRSVAVANALSAVREEADLVTAGAEGEGVRELIERLLAGDPLTGTSHLRQ